MEPGLTSHADERRRGFSLIEMLVVVAVLSILVTMGYAALCRGRLMSKDTQCESNLKQITLALGLYCNEHSFYPTEDLKRSLAPYVGDSPELFICPADPNPMGDSYSRYYVSRSDHSTQDYVCGCPHHVHETKTIALFSSASAHRLELRPVLWNGQPIRPGTRVSSGVLSFGDGSTVTIPSQMVVRLIHSFRLHDGRYYSLIGADINELGTLDITVTPGSRFEVVTPAVVAGVQGTRFLVTSYVDRDKYCVKVQVREGEVLVRHRWQHEPRRLFAAGEDRLVQFDRSALYSLLPQEWESRRNRLADDGQ